MDGAYTKLLGDALLNAKGFYDYGIKHGLTSPDDLRLTIAKRRELAKELVDNGVSKRQAAKILGVSHTTVERDVPGNGTKRSMDVQHSYDEWSTPQDLFDELDAEFKFDLDVCALPSNTKCARYFTPDTPLAAPA